METKEQLKTEFDAICNKYAERIKDAFHAEAVKLEPGLMWAYPIPGSRCHDIVFRFGSGKWDFLGNEEGEFCVETNIGALGSFQIDKPGNALSYYTFVGRVLDPEGARNLKTMLREFDDEIDPICIKMRALANA